MVVTVAIFVGVGVDDVGIDIDQNCFIHDIAVRIDYDKV